MATSGLPHTTIEIPTMYFDVLSNWASVGRTIDTTMKLLEGLALATPICNFPDNTDMADVDMCLGELRDLKQALDACNHACKAKLHEDTMKVAHYAASDPTR